MRTGWRWAPGWPRGAGLAVAAVLALGLAHGPTTLLDALAGLGAPAPIVSTLHFMMRYGSVLADERDRMLTARRARTFRLEPRWREWLGLGGLLGALLLRALERGERVHAAMLARGWDGTIRSLGTDGDVDTATRRGGRR